MFTPKLGEDEPILTHIFRMGWFNHQPDNLQQGSIGKEALLSTSTSVSRVNEVSFC